MAIEYKSVIAIDLGASTLRMRLSRYAPGIRLQPLGDVVLALDSLPIADSNIAFEELSAGPKRLLEASECDPGRAPDDGGAVPMFCPNSACGLARREWPSTATVCALCRTRLVPRASIVAEELIAHAMTRAIFDMERLVKRTVRPDIVLASTPTDWSTEIRYRYVDFLRKAFPDARPKEGYLSIAGPDVRLVDDPVAIARDASDSPDLWKLKGDQDGLSALTGIFPGERVLVIDSGARRTQFYTAVSSPRIGFFDPAYAVEVWGGIDCDQLISSSVADHLQVECTSEVSAAWSRAIRHWKEALSTSMVDPSATAQPLHLPIGGDTAETLAVGPPADETASILRSIEERVTGVVDKGLAALAMSTKVDVVLLAGGNARWTFFEQAIRARLADAKIAITNVDHAAVVCGLPSALLADTVVWRVAPGYVEDDDIVEEEQQAAVPTITELFAAPAAATETERVDGEADVPSSVLGQ